MSMMSIPWWGKIGAKLVLSRLPFGYSIWQRLGLFRHGQMDASDYAIKVFDQHVRKAGLEGKLAGRTLLELGPGDSVASAIMASTYGAQAMLVDSGDFIRSDVGPYRELVNALSKRGLQPPKIDDCADVTAILKRTNAIYLTDGFRSLSKLAPKSVDLIFSQAVLEHVRKAEFLATMEECRRITKDAGIGSHQIDLRDHLAGALNNLRFSERLWEADWFANSGFYTNRISMTRMLEFFKQAGFAVEVTNIRRWSSLPTAKKAMVPQFRQLADEELCISGFEVLLR